MTVSLTSIISALEKKMDGTDSSSNLTDVLRLANAADDFTSSVFYDSSGLMPTNDVFKGTMARDKDGTVFIYDGTDWTRPNQNGSLYFEPTQAQGSTNGYAAGGSNPSSRPSTNYNSISRFSFANEATGADHGDLTATKEAAGGNSSSSHGYVVGGFTRPSYTIFNVIEKFAFASSSNATDVGDDLGVNHYGQGSPSPTHGYHAGGFPNGPAGMYTAIRRYSFSSDENASSTGTLNRNVFGRGSYTSTTDGYVVGLGSATAEKFPFAASGASSSSVGTLNTQYAQASNSHLAGYYHDLYNAQDMIKTPFATDTSSTLFTMSISPVANWYQECSTCSSTTDGYWQGHFNGNSIWKFNFSSEGVVTDTADLSNSTHQGSTGHQF